MAEISATVDYSSKDEDIALAVKGGIDAHINQKQQDFAIPRQP